MPDFSFDLLSCLDLPEEHEFDHKNREVTYQGHRLWTYARKALREKEKFDCPCCTGRIAIYKRKLDWKCAQFLCRLYALDVVARQESPETLYFSLDQLFDRPEERALSLTSPGSICRFWDLIDVPVVNGKITKNPMLYAITETGRKFIKDQSFRIPKYKYTLMGQILNSRNPRHKFLIDSISEKETEQTVNFQEVSQAKFNLAESLSVMMEEYKVSWHDGNRGGRTYSEIYESATGRSPDDSDIESGDDAVDWFDNDVN